MLRVTFSDTADNDLADKVCVIKKSDKKSVFYIPKETARVGLVIPASVDAVNGKNLRHCCSMNLEVNCMPAVRASFYSYKIDRQHLFCIDQGLLSDDNNRLCVGIKTVHQTDWDMCSNTSDWESEDGSESDTESVATVVNIDSGIDETYGDDQ